MHIFKIYTHKLAMIKQNIFFHIHDHIDVCAWVQLILL